MSNQTTERMTPEKLAEFRELVQYGSHLGVGGKALALLLDEIEACWKERPHEPGERDCVKCGEPIENHDCPQGFGAPIEPGGWPTELEAAKRVGAMALGAAGQHAERVLELEAEVSTLRESLAEVNRLLSLNVAEVARLQSPEPAETPAQRKARQLLQNAFTLRDHFTYCDRTMGDTNGCTCGMDAYAKLLRELDQQPETKSGDA